MPFSSREQWVLWWAGPDGELPEALARLDPAILEMVCSEIMDCRAGVQWDDIAGQEDAKRLVQELVVWPMLNPHLFRVRAPKAMIRFQDYFLATLEPILLATPNKLSHAKACGSHEQSGAY